MRDVYDQSWNIQLFTGYSNISSQKETFAWKVSKKREIVKNENGFLDYNTPDVYIMSVVFCMSVNRNAQKNVLGFRNDRILKSWLGCKIALKAC